MKRKKFKIIKFKLSNKDIITLHSYKTNEIIANTPPETQIMGLFGLSYGIIKVDKLFYRFSKKEQEAIIYHELWHKKKNIFFELSKVFSCIWIKNPFSFDNEVAKLQEFEADLYAAIRFNKIITLNVIRKIRKMQKTGEVPIDLKRHPPIEERIKRIENLKL